VVDEVTFSSARKWSALAFSDKNLRGVYALGALEMLEPYLKEPANFAEQVDTWSSQGLRVLLFAYHPVSVPLFDDQGKPSLPPLVPLALLAFTDVLRPEAQATLAQFVRAGINLKVISGDNPQTVAALAKQAGLPGDLKAVSGVELEDMDKAQFVQVTEETTVFGRIRPEQKEALVDVLRDRGYYVAMIGDGVNDVLSLKKAHLGIAMQSGSSATRSVADMVLLDDSFAALPPAFLEGQRINSGMRDILRLYVARAAQLVLLILAVSFVGMGFPYIPTHVNLVALLTIGIPTFALAVWAKPGKSDQDLVMSVIHFAFPAGLTIFFFGFLLYTYTFHGIVNEDRTLSVLQEDVASFQRYAGIDYEIYTQDEFVYEVAVLYSQSVLTVFSVLSGLLLILFVEPPVWWFVGGDKYSGDWRPTILAGGMLVMFIVFLAIPSVRQFWQLLPLEWFDWGVVIVTTIVWAVVLRTIWRANLFERFLHLEFVNNLLADDRYYES
jgi:cation-transporting ATPase E